MDAEDKCPTKGKLDWDSWSKRGSWIEILAIHEEHATRNSHSFASSPSQYVLILLCIQLCFGHRNNKGEEDSVTGLTVDCVPPGSPEPGPLLMPSSQSASSHLLLSEYGNEMNAYWSSEARDNGMQGSWKHGKGCHRGLQVCARDWGMRVVGEFAVQRGGHNRVEEGRPLLSGPEGEQKGWYKI